MSNFFVMVNITNNNWIAKSQISDQLNEYNIGSFFNKSNKEI